MTTIRLRKESWYLPEPSMPNPEDDGIWKTVFLILLLIAMIAISYKSARGQHSTIYDIYNPHKNLYDFKPVEIKPSELTPSITPIEFYKPVFNPSNSNLLFPIEYPKEIKIFDVDPRGFQQVFPTEIIKIYENQINYYRVNQLGITEILPYRIIR